MLVYHKLISFLDNQNSVICPLFQNCFWYTKLRRKKNDLKKKKENNIHLSLLHITKKYISLSIEGFGSH